MALKRSSVEISPLKALCQTHGRDCIILTRARVFITAEWEPSERPSRTLCFLRRSPRLKARPVIDVFNQAALEFSAGPTRNDSVGSKKMSCHWAS
uniref:Uncharacterized protein n=1 Tax=Knipowitschia caucasica TaxID=637954 RepID=A0AAV2JGL3_KNICA